MPKYLLYLAMHNGRPSLIVEIPSMKRFKFVVNTADSFAALRNDYMYYKTNTNQTMLNIHQYVIPAAQQYMSQQQQAV